MWTSSAPADMSREEPGQQVSFSGANGSQAKVCEGDRARAGCCRGAEEKRRAREKITREACNLRLSIVHLSMADGSEASLVTQDRSIGRNEE